MIMNKAIALLFVLGFVCSTANAEGIKKNKISISNDKEDVSFDQFESTIVVVGFEYQRYIHPDLSYEVGYGLGYAESGSMVQGNVRRLHFGASFSY